jgi:hypothetical protein
MEQDKIVTGSYRNRHNKVEFNLFLKGWFDQETGFHFLYSPALDLTGYGETFEAAKRSFEFTLDEFIKYTHTKNTIFDELEHLGWLVNRRKKRVQAPDIEHLLEDNETFRNLENRPGVINTQEDFNLQLV